MGIIEKRALGNVPITTKIGSPPMAPQKRKFEFDAQSSQFFELGRGFFQRFANGDERAGRGKIQKFPSEPVVVPESLRQNERLRTKVRSGLLWGFLALGTRRSIFDFRVDFGVFSLGHFPSLLFLWKGKDMIFCNFSNLDFRG
jgi:hypothetical protein